MNKEEIEILIAKCKKMDRSSQGKLYSYFSAKMFAVCRIYSNSYEDAQDTFQEAFLTAFQKLNQYNSNGSFEGWLRRIMVNSCLEKYRKQKKLLTVRAKEEIIENKEEVLNEEFNYSQQELLEMINELPERYRIVFTLYVLDNFSHSDIAEELDISVGTSKSNLARARVWLQDRLKKKNLQKRDINRKIKNEASY